MGGTDYPGKEILGAGSPRAVLVRLMDGDPLEIEPRCRERLRTEAWFIALDRLALRAFARIAHAAPLYRGTPSLDAWITGRIDASVEDLLREDIEEERAAIPPTEPWDPRYAFVSETLGLRPELARKACNAFNGLPSEVRRTYFAIYVDKKSVNRWVAEGNGPPERFEEFLKRAFETFSLPWGEENRWFEGRDRDE